MSVGTENNSRFASIAKAANEIPFSIVRGVLRLFKDFSLLDFEESVAGKSGASYINDDSNKIVSYSTIGLAVILGLFASDGLLAMLNSTTDAVLTDGRVVSFSESFLYSIISALALIMAWWVTLTVLIKQTFRKSVSTALLGISTAWIIFIVTRGLSHFILIEADWVVVWANRDLVMMGQLMKEQMTQSPGSAMCIDVNDCYGINQNFRLWWTTYLACSLFGAAYGTSDKNPLKFAFGFGIIAGIVTLIATCLLYTSPSPRDVEEWGVGGWWL